MCHLPDEVLLGMEPVIALGNDDTPPPPPPVRPEATSAAPVT